jgi:hypothetical protein
MAKTATAPTVDLQSLISDSLKDVSEGSSTPFCQIISPPRIDDMDMIRGMAGSFGMAVTKENAEKLNFKPDDSWEFISKKLGGQSVEMWMTRQPRFVIAVRSPYLVEWKEFDKNKEGLYYAAYNQTTPQGKLCEDRTPGYTKFTRQGVILIGADNKPLHDGVFSLKVKGGFSVTLGFAYKQLASTIESVFKANGSGAKKISELSPYFIYDLSLDCYKSNASTSSPYTYVSSVGIVGDKTKVITDSSTTPAREVEVVGKQIQEVMVFEQLNPVLYAAIKKAKEDYPQFGYKASADAEAIPTIFKGSGKIDLQSDPKFTDLGVECKYVSGDNSYRLLIPSVLVDEIVGLAEDKNPDFNIEGTVEGGLLKAALITPAVNYDEIPF